ncbi:MAG: hypothetical protein HY532_09640 [Chloroflexi bacterium]|nr:hypothetical protein [Chloroflexota bacterium]
MMYRIEYSPRAVDHLQGLTARNRAIVHGEVQRQLVDQPDVPTRNRKLLRANELAVWEMRIDTFWVYYDVQAEPETVVKIRAIGVKRGNQIFIAGKEVTW